MEEKTKCEHCQHECSLLNQLGACDCPAHCEAEHAMERMEPVE